jgi:hypothetical protein
MPTQAQPRSACGAGVPQRPLDAPAASLPDPCPEGNAAPSPVAEIGPDPSDHRPGGIPSAGDSGDAATAVTHGLLPGAALVPLASGSVGTPSRPRFLQALCSPCHSGLLAFQRHLCATRDMGAPVTARRVTQRHPHCFAGFSGALLAAPHSVTTGTSWPSRQRRTLPSRPRGIRNLRPQGPAFVRRTGWIPQFLSSTGHLQRPRARRGQPWRWARR